MTTVQLRDVSIPRLPQSTRVLCRGTVYGITVDTDRLSLWAGPRDYLVQTDAGSYEWYDDADVEIVDEEPEPMFGPGVR